MGDYTLLEFLKAWDLLPKFEENIDYFIALWPSEESKYLGIDFEVADKLRGLNKNCFVWLDKKAKLEKQLKYADLKKARFVLIIGEEELEKKTITVKDMRSGTQENKPLEKFFAELK
jgi:histidyl-tRNA synthetase